MFCRLNGVSNGESSLCDFFFQNLEDLLNVEEEIVLTRTSFFGKHLRTGCVFCINLHAGSSIGYFNFDFCIALTSQVC